MSTVTTDDIIREGQENSALLPASYRNVSLVDGQPILDANGNDIAPGWKVDSSLDINDPGTGVSVVTLKNDAGDVKVLVRGTANMQNAYADGTLSQNIQYQTHVKEITEYLRDVIETGNNVTFVGHSYAGNCVLHSAIDLRKDPELASHYDGNPDAYNNQVKVLTYNSAGMPGLKAEHKDFLDNVTTNYRTSISHNIPIPGYPNSQLSAGDPVSVMFAHPGKVVEVLVSADFNEATGLSGFGASFATHFGVAFRDAQWNSAEIVAEKGVPGIGGLGEVSAIIANAATSVGYEPVNTNFDEALGRLMVGLGSFSSDLPGYYEVKAREFLGLDIPAEYQSAENVFNALIANAEIVNSMTGQSGLQLTNGLSGDYVLGLLDDLSSALIIQGKITTYTSEAAQWLDNLWSNFSSDLSVSVIPILQSDKPEISEIDTPLGPQVLLKWEDGRELSISESGEYSYQNSTGIKVWQGDDGTRTVFRPNYGEETTYPEGHVSGVKRTVRLENDELLTFFTDGNGTFESNGVLVANISHGSWGTEYRKVDEKGFETGEIRTVFTDGSSTYEDGLGNTEVYFSRDPSNETGENDLQYFIEADDTVEQRFWDGTGEYYVLDEATGAYELDATIKYGDEWMELTRVDENGDPTGAYRITYDNGVSIGVDENGNSYRQVWDSQTYALTTYWGDPESGEITHSTVDGEEYRVSFNEVTGTYSVYDKAGNLFDIGLTSDFNSGAFAQSFGVNGFETAPHTVVTPEYNEYQNGDYTVKVPTSGTTFNDDSGETVAYTTTHISGTVKKYYANGNTKIVYPESFRGVDEVETDERGMVKYKKFSTPIDLNTENAIEAISVVPKAMFEAVGVQMVDEVRNLGGGAWMIASEGQVHVLDGISDTPQVGYTFDEKTGNTAVVYAGGRSRIYGEDVIIETVIDPETKEKTSYSIPWDKVPVGMEDDGRAALEKLEGAVKIDPKKAFELIAGDDDAETPDKIDSLFPKQLEGIDPKAGTDNGDGTPQPNYTEGVPPAPKSETSTCFAGATPILMADGQEKPIAEIQVNDMVMAFDGRGELEARRVSHLYRHEEKELTEMSDGMRLTPMHRFLTEDDDYRAILEIEKGKGLVRANGNVVPFTGLKPVSGRHTVYNMTVEGLHTYVAGGYRVHNGKQKPVMLDLNGNNIIDLIGLEDSEAFFNFDGGSFKDQTGWVSGGDGILAIDIGGDGIIDQADEIVFSNHHDAAMTDFDGLRLVFDSNRDGVLSASDDRWSEFRVWQDANEDGVSDAGEVMTLADLGITSIGLHGSGQQEERDGNFIFGYSDFTRADGTTGMVADVALQTGDLGFAWGEDADGNTVLTDETGRKQAIVDNVYGASIDLASAGLSEVIGSDGNDTLFTFEDTGVRMVGGHGHDMLSGGDGNDILVGGSGQDYLIGGGGNDVITFDMDDAQVNGGLGFDIGYVEGDKGAIVDLADLNIEVLFGTDKRDIITSSGFGAELMDGGAGHDVLRGGRGDDYLSGGEGNDLSVVKTFGPPEHLI